MSRMLRTILAAAIVAGLLVFGSIASPAPASAATGRGNAYVAFPLALGNCPSGGKVTRVWASNGDLWSTDITGEKGDDKLYVKVNLNQVNEISYKVFCSKSWYRTGSGWSVVSQASITPTYNKQTFWLGPFGVWYKTKGTKSTPSKVIKTWYDG